MAGKKTFLKEYFKSNKEVGAFFPSSKFLGKKMLKHVDFEDSKILVELGPGTGVFTQQIIEKLTADSVLYVFETNKTFYNDLILKINHPQVKIFNESAENVVEILKKDGHEQADCIISSLPLTVIPSEIKSRIMDAAHKALKEGGFYLQFQYSLNALRLFKRTFKNVKLDFTPLNVPPAFVYKCVK